MGSTRNGIDFCFNSQTVLILLLLLKTVCGIDLLLFNKKMAVHLNPINSLIDGRAHEPIITLRTFHGHHVPFLGLASGSLREFRVRFSILDTIGRGMTWVTSRRILSRYHGTDVSVKSRVHL